MPEWNRLEKIQTAVEVRDRFLKKHPELKPFQEEIERRLANAGSLENRLAVLGFMLCEQNLEFDQKLLQLKERLEVHLSGRTIESASSTRMKDDGKSRR
jgi:hypothetical protein